MILLEDEIKQRLKELSNQKARYIIDFNYGNIIIKEIDSKVSVEDIQYMLNDMLNENEFLKNQIKELEKEIEGLEEEIRDLKAEIK